MASSREHILAQTQKRMHRVFTPNQVLGRLKTIGCVAVEITQRCNLDCTLCYLSENSQAVRDIPIREVFKRLDAVLAHYGPGAEVQITGGDPTLRKHTELIAIVRYAKDIGLYPALFTNGIAASRPLLTQLAEAGLCDVAFHVDTTQRREGYDNEVALNALREEYIERTRGLGLTVIFNTTVHRDNFAELPQLIQFFARHADIVGLTSFQLQAETGRGEWRARDIIINKQTVQKQLEEGIGKPMPWEVVQVGHTDCHSYMPTIVSNDSIFPIVDDVDSFSDFMRDFSHVSWDRQASTFNIVATFLFALIKQPRWWLKLIKHGCKQIRLMAKDLVKSAGRTHKLTIFVQNFMDAKHLEDDRIDACSFMVMTAEGPVSMCKHNAKRDDYILKPLDVANDDGSTEHYEPLKWRDPSRAKNKTAQASGARSGAMQPNAIPTNTIQPSTIPLKQLNESG